MIEYVHRSTLDIAYLNTAHKRKDISRLYHIFEDDFVTKVTTKWKPDLNMKLTHFWLSEVKINTLN